MIDKRTESALYSYSVLVYREHSLCPRARPRGRAARVKAHASHRLTGAGIASSPAARGGPACGLRHEKNAKRIRRAPRVSGVTECGVSARKATSWPGRYGAAPEAGRASLAARAAPESCPSRSSCASLSPSRRSQSAARRHPHVCSTPPPTPASGSSAWPLSRWIAAERHLPSQCESTCHIRKLVVVQGAAPAGLSQNQSGRRRRGARPRDALPPLPARTRTRSSA